MAFSPRSSKQRLADIKLSVRRGPSVGQDTQSRDPLNPMDPMPARPKGPPGFKMKSPSFGRKPPGGRSLGGRY